MGVFRELIGKFGIAWELLGSIGRRKLWWMYPLVFVLLFFGILIGAGTSTGVGPFIYTMF